MKACYRSHCIKIVTELYALMGLESRTKNIKVHQVSGQHNFWNLRDVDNNIFSIQTRYQADCIKIVTEPHALTLSEIRYNSIKVYQISRQSLLWTKKRH